MNFENNLTHNLNFLMQSRGISATDLCKETGIRPATLYKIKDGVIVNPTLETVYPISQYFGYTVNELVELKLLGELPNNDTSRNNLIPLIKQEDIEKFPNSTIIKYISPVSLNTKTAFCIEVIDDNSRFEQGSLLIIDKKLIHENKDFIIVKRILDNTLSIKRVLFDDEYYIQSVTKGLEHKLYSFSEYEVLGIVIGYIKHFRMS